MFFCSYYLAQSYYLPLLGQSHPAGLNELRTRGQSHAELIECAAIAANCKPRIAPDAATIEPSPESRGRVIQNRSDRR